VGVQNGAVVNHHLRAYIRELAYRASIGGADPVAVAAVAGLGEPDTPGRFVTRMRSTHVHVADAILTDLLSQTALPEAVAPENP
jgi:hypothetical protein